MKKLLRLFSFCVIVLMMVVALGNVNIVNAATKVLSNVAMTIDEPVVGKQLAGTITLQSNLSQEPVTYLTNKTYIPEIASSEPYKIEIYWSPRDSVAKANTAYTISYSMLIPSNATVSNNCTATCNGKPANVSTSNDTIYISYTFNTESGTGNNGRKWN